MKSVLLNIKLLVIITLVSLSNPALATADAETPEQELEILRLLLLETKVHEALAKMKEAGCQWHSEFIWFGAPKKIEENRYLWGGELVVQFEPEYSHEKSLRIRFTGEHTSSRRTIDSVTVETSDSIFESCT